MKKTQVRAKDILSKLNKMNCTGIESIEDITNQQEYIDEVPDGKTDTNLVACGQDDSYNELQYIYDTKLEPIVRMNKITKQAALEALCLCCSELKHPRHRDKYYKCLSKNLGIEI